MKATERIFKLLSFTLSALTYGGAGVAGAGVLFMALITTITVLGRYLFNSPLRFADELASYSMVAIVFMGLAYTMMKGGHIKVEVIISRVPLKTRLVLEAACFIIGLVLLTGIFAGVLSLTAESYYEGSKSNTSLHTPLFLPQLFMPVGVGMLLLRFIAGFYNNLKTIREGGKSKT